jgi:SAM-dependent methyltransferase
MEYHGIFRIPNRPPIHGLFRDLCLMPYKFRRLKRLQNQKFKFLDIGCGNHSAQMTRYWFPGCDYYGVDHGLYNNDPDDFALMTEYYDVDLDHEKAAIQMEAIPNEFFDVVMLAHVVEHLRNPFYVLDVICRKVRVGGEIYLEFPSLNSLSLPNMPTLNFCDDHTHVYVHSIQELCNFLLQRGFVIRRAGRRRDWVLVLLTPLAFVISFLRHRRIDGVHLWDLMGFADYVWAAKMN